MTARLLAGDPYGLAVAGLVFGRRMHYRLRHGVWCEHPSRTGRLIDMGMRKLWTCRGCGHHTFRYPGTVSR